MEPQILAFLVLATTAIAGGIITLWSKYIVHATFGLMMSLLGVAGFYVLLGSDLLAVTQVVVYVGGVVILYLFGVMLTPPDLEERSKLRIGIVGGLATVAGILLIAAVNGMSTSGWQGLDPEGGVPDAAVSVIDSVGRSFMNKDQYLLVFELASVLLLVALIGAVYVARRRGEPSQ